MGHTIVLPLQMAAPTGWVQSPLLAILFWYYWLVVPLSVSFCVCCVYDLTAE